MIDVSFDFTTDSRGYWDGFWEKNEGLGYGGADPDKDSPTLRTYHQVLWSKKLPNGEFLNLEKGKYVPGTTGTIPMVLGIPNSALIPGKEYFLIAVMPGGKIVILKDLDDDPNTVTFDAIPGNNAFALAYK